jgi:hypothetical protein
MFSSYWCTAIFAKSRSLHYVLKKQRKSTSEKRRYFRRDNAFKREMTFGTLIIAKSSETTL